MPASSFNLFSQRLLVERLICCYASSSLHKFCLSPRISAPSLLSNEGITLMFSCDIAVLHMLVTVTFGKVEPLKRRHPGEINQLLINIYPRHVQGWTVS